jgi:hypothetical protein
MLGRIEECPDLADQACLFTLDQSLGGLASRWLYCPELIRRPWILWREAGDDIHQLLVDCQAIGRILVFSSENGVEWERSKAVTYDEAADVIPRAHRHTSWMSKPASQKQVAVVSDISGKAPDELPPLCVYSVTALIQIRRMAIKLNTFDYLIRSWEFDIENSYGRQSVMFPYLEKMFED